MTQDTRALWAEWKIRFNRYIAETFSVFRFRVVRITALVLAGAVLGYVLILALSWAIVAGTGGQYARFWEYEPSLRGDYALVSSDVSWNPGDSRRAQRCLLRAKTLLDEGAVTKILLTGPASSEMANYLLLLDVPAEMILVDRYAMDLYDSVFRAREAFPEGFALACVQEQHMPRMGYAMDSVGLEGVCVNADLIIPTLGASGLQQECHLRAALIWRCLTSNRAQAPLYAYPLEAP